MNIKQYKYQNIIILKEQNVYEGHVMCSIRLN